MAKKDLERIDRTQTAVSASVHVGYFQSLCNFMGFNEGLMAMIEEPEEVYELFEYMSSFWVQICSKIRDYYKPDIWGVTDDTATATNPFISPETYRNLVKPFHQREAAFGVEMGIPINMHNCGRCEDFIDDWLDIGVTCWNPAQTMNDLVGIKKRFQGRLAIAGGWDRSRTDKIEDMDEYRAEVEKYVDTFASNGGFVFMAMAGGDKDDPLVQRRSEIIKDVYFNYAYPWYKNH